MAYDDPRLIDDEDEDLDESPTLYAPPLRREVGAATVGVPEPMTDAAQLARSPSGEKILPRDQPLKPRPMPKPPKLMDDREVFNEAARRGAITPGEMLRDKFLGPKAVEQIPFFGGFFAASDEYRAELARRRLVNNEYSDLRHKQRDIKFLTEKLNEDRVKAARGNYEWYGIPVTDVADIVSSQFKYIAEMAVAKRLAYDPAKAGLVRKFATSPDQMKRVSLIASKRLLRLGVEEGAANFPKLLRQAENQVLLNMVKRDLGTNLLTSLGGIAAMSPFFAGMTMESLAKDMAPVVEYDERGIPRIEQSQKDFLRSLVDAKLKTMGEIGFEMSLTRFLLAPVGRLLKPFKDATTRAFRKLLPVKLTKALEAAALKQTSFHPAVNTVKSDALVENIRGYKRAADMIMSRVFTSKGFAPSAAIGGVAEEFMEEWATGVYNSVLNLDRDEKFHADGTPMSWTSRVIDSLAMPVTQPKDALAMVIAFSVLPAGRGALEAVADRQTVKLHERNARAFRRVMDSKDIISPEARNSLVTALEDIVRTEDTRKWFAPIFKKWKFAQKPRARTLASMMGVKLEPGNLTEAYWKAEMGAKGTGGRKYLHDLVDSAQMGLVAKTDADYKMLMDLKERDLMSVTSSDYRRKEEIRNLELKANTLKAIIDKPNTADVNPTALANAKKQLGKYEAEIAYKKATREAALTGEMRARQDKVGRAIADVEVLNEIRDNPDHPLYQYLTFHIPTTKAGQLAADIPVLAKVDSKLLKSGKARAQLLNRMRDRGPGHRRNLSEIFDQMEALKLFDRLDFVLKPSLIAKGVAGHAGTGFQELRAQVSSQPARNGRWQIFFTLDATARDIMEELVERGFHEMRLAGNTAQASDIANSVIKLFRDQFDKAKNIASTEDNTRAWLDWYESNHLANRKPAEMFELFSSIGALALGAKVEARDAGTEEGYHQRAFYLLMEQDPKFLPAVRGYMEALMGPVEVEAFSQAAQMGALAREAIAEADAVKAAPAAAVVDPKADEDDQLPGAEAKPVEAKPVEDKPVEAKPVEAKPVEAKPVEAKPVEAPAVTPPAVTPPVAGKLEPAAKERKSPTEEGQEDQNNLQAAGESEGAKQEEPEGLKAWTQRQEAFNKAFMDALGLEDTDLARQSVFAMLDASKDNMGKAIESEKTWDEYKKSRGGSALEQRFKDAVRAFEARSKQPVTVDDATGLYNHNTNKRIRKSFQLGMREDGKIDKLKTPSSNTLPSMGLAIGRAVLAATNTPGAFKTLVRKFSGFKRKVSKMTAGEFIVSLFGNIFEPAWVTEMDDFNNANVIPKGFASLEAYQAARMRYAQFTSDSDYPGATSAEKKTNAENERELLMSRLAGDDVKLKKQWWVDSVVRSLMAARLTYITDVTDKKDPVTGKVIKKAPLSKQVALTKLRVSIVNDVFTSISHNPRAIAARENTILNMPSTVGPASAPNLLWWGLLNEDRLEMRPYHSYSPSGKRVDLVVYNTQLDASLENHPEYSDYIYFEGIFTGINEYTLSRPAEGEMRRSKFEIEAILRKKLSADGSELSGEDLMKASRYLFDNSDKPGTFYMWAGPVGENNTLPFVRVTRHEKGTIDAMTDMEKRYAEMREALVASLLAKQEGEKDPKAAEAAADRFMPSVSTLLSQTDAFTYNFMINYPFLARAIHGDFAEYKDPSDFHKRATPILTPKITPHTSGNYEEGSRFIGPTYNAVVFDDAMFPQELKDKLVEETDGLGFMLDVWAPLLQNSLGSWVTGKKKGEKFMQAKALHTGADEESGARRLYKFNLVTLTEDLVERNPQSVYSGVAKLIKEYNEGRELKDQIHVVYFSSAAKKSPKEKVVTIFERGTAKLLPKMKVPSDAVMQLDSSEFGYLFDSRHPIIPEIRKIPKQKASDLAGLSAAEYEDQAQLGRRLAALHQLEKANGFDLKAQLSSEGMPWLESIISGREQPDARSMRVVNAQLTYLLNKLTRNQGSMLHVVEVPLGAAADKLKSMHAVRKAGKGVYEPLKYTKAGAVPEGAEHVVLADVNLNVPSSVRTTMQSPLRTFDEHIDLIRRKYMRFLDMFVPDAEMVQEMADADGRIYHVLRTDNVDDKGRVKWNIQEWELRKQPDSDLYRIPGELVMYTRVPGDNRHSHTLARVNDRVSNEGNFIQTSREERIAAGIDFDVDSRFVEIFFKDNVKDAEGKKTKEYMTSWLVDGENQTRLSAYGELNMSMLMWASDYQDPANMPSFKAPVDKKFANDIVEKYKGRDSGSLADPAAAIQARDDARIGKEGLEIAAAENAGMSLLTEQEVFIKADAIKKWEVMEVDGDKLSFIPEGMTRPLIFSLTTADAAARRKESFEAIKWYLGNILNMFADNLKDDDVRHLGITEVTQNLATALFFANADVVDQKGVLEYLDTVAEYLHTTPVQDYIRKQRGKDSVAAATVAKTKKAGEASDTEKFLKIVTAISSDLFPVMQIARDNGEMPARVSGYLKTRASVASVRNNDSKYLDTGTMAKNWDKHDRLKGIDASMEAARRFVFQNEPMLSKAGESLLGQALANKPAADADLYEERLRSSLAMMAAWNMLSPEARKKVDEAPMRTVDKKKSTAEQKKQRAALTEAGGSYFGWLDRMHDTFMQVKNNPDYLDNAFIQALELEIGKAGRKKIRLLKLYSSDFANVAPETIAAIQAGWDQLYKSNPDFAVDLVRYSIAQHGITYKASHGGLMSLVGPKLSKAVNDAQLTEMARWQKHTFNPKDAVEIAGYIKRGFGFEPRKLDTARQVARKAEGEAVVSVTAVEEVERIQEEAKQDIADENAELAVVIPVSETSLAQEWSAAELWKPEMLEKELTKYGNEAVWVRYKLAPAGSTPKMAGTMYFAYGKTDPGAEYGTTFKAIQAGARTSTTRFKAWPQYDKYAALKPGDVVRFWSTKTVGQGEYVDVEVTSVQKVTKAELAVVIPSAEGTKVTGFQGFKGGYSPVGKGTPAGDGKDKAMRDVADSAIVELASERPSSSKTTLDTLGPVDEHSTTVMLARNGSLRGRPLRQETVASITDLAQNLPGVRFVVGDMPGVDSPFIDLLQKLGATFEVYHAGRSSRVSVAAPAVEGKVAPMDPAPVKPIGKDTTPQDSLAILRRDGTVDINEAAVRADFEAGFPYLKGESNLKGSAQKKEVMKRIDLVKFKAALGSVDRYLEFIRIHEEGHRELHKEKGYPKDWMSPTALRMEREANKYALDKMGISVESIRKTDESVESVQEPTAVEPATPEPVQEPEYKPSRKQLVKERTRELMPVAGEAVKAPTLTEADRKLVNSMTRKFSPTELAQREQQAQNKLAVAYAAELRELHDLYDIAPKSRTQDQKDRIKVLEDSIVDAGDYYKYEDAIGGKPGQGSFTFSAVAFGTDEQGNVSMGFGFEANRRTYEKIRNFFRSGDWKSPGRTRATFEKAGLNKAEGDYLLASLKAVGFNRGDDFDAALKKVKDQMPKLKIVEVPQYDSLAVDPEDTNFRYEYLSVNKGQGTYKEYMIHLPFEVPGQHGSFTAPNLAGWFRVREYRATRTLEVQEIQSELFQKHKDGFKPRSETATLETVDTFQTYVDRIYLATVRRRPDGLFESDSRQVGQWTVLTDAEARAAWAGRSAWESWFIQDNKLMSPEQAAFLNLMLKDQTWVSVFTNAITQFAEKQGFEKVRFPTGETAARVEGHQALADRLAELQEERETAPVGAEAERTWDRAQAALAEARNIGDPERGGWARRVKRPQSLVDAEIQNLKTQGIEKLAPIEAFYEKRIASIANKMGAVPVTDANGNTWREVSIAPSTATFSAVEAFLSAPKRLPDIGYEMTVATTPKLSPKFKDKIRANWQRVKEIQRYLTRPEITEKAKFDYLDETIRSLPATAKLGNLKALRDLFSPETLARETSDRFKVEGIEVAPVEVRKILSDVDGDLEFTYAAVSMNLVARDTKRSVAVGFEMQQQLLKSIREQQAAEKRDARQSAIWHKDTKALASRLKIDEVILQSALGVNQENSKGHIFNDARMLTNEDGSIKFNPQTGKPVYEAFWVDPKTGKRADEIESLAPYRGTGLFAGALTVESVMAAAVKADAELVDRLKTEFREKTKGQLGEANIRVGDLGAGGASSDWIGDLSAKRGSKAEGFITHEYRFAPADLEKPNRDLIKLEHLKELTEAEKAKLTDAELDGVLDIKYEAAMKRYNAAVELAKSTMRARNEESGRSQTRMYDTYDEAVMDAGLLPKTLEMSGLYTTWQKSVSEVIRNKQYLTLGSLSLDVDGRMAMIPVKLAEQRKADKDTAINKVYAAQIYRNLREFANKMVPGNRTVFALEVGQDPWVQIEKITTAIQEHLKDMGYERISMDRFNLAHVWVKQGAPAGLLKHITSRGFEDLRKNHPGWYKFLNGVKLYNNFTKSLALGLSVFHHMALTESYAAGFGLTTGNPLLSPVHAVAHFRKLRQMLNRLQTDPELGARWTRAGLSFDTDAPDYDIGMVDKWLTDMSDATGKTSLTRLHLRRNAIRMLKKVKNAADNFLWHQMQPAMKVQLAEYILSEAQSDLRYAGVATDLLMSDIAGYVNDAFGGQEWQQYVWANPMSRDIMQSVIFAPDWSISALNIAGIPQMLDAVLGTQLSKQAYTQLAQRQMAEAYWPAFAMIVLVGVPAAVQAAIYMAFGGDPDEDEYMFPMMNEAGRKSYIDISPLMRKLGAKYGITNRRKTYLRWGKQAWEILGWLTNPVKVFSSKTSMAVKTTMEQLMGKNSAWWDMPWIDAPGLGLFHVDGKFSKSRLYALGAKFLPMSVMTMAEGRPASFFAPARLGQSKTEATNTLIPILYAYASKEVEGEIAGRGEMLKSMQQVASAILDAAEANGYDRKEVFQAALSKVTGKIYLEMFEELNRRGGPRDEKMVEILRRYRRAGGAYKNMRQSLKKRISTGNRALDADTRQSMMQAWQESKKAQMKKGSPQE